MKKRIITLLLLLVLSISLIGCTKNDPEVVSINNQIEELTNIQDNRESILEIMNIREEIDKLSKQQKRWINVKELNKLSIKTTNKLKDNSIWKECVNIDVDFVSINELIDLSQISEIWFVYKALSSISPNVVDDNATIELFSEIINLPYSLVTNATNFDSNVNSGNFTERFNFEHVDIVVAKSTTNRPNIYFYGNWVCFKIIKNDEIHTYISLIELSQEQITSILNMSKMVAYK